MVKSWESKKREGAVRIESFLFIQEDVTAEIRWAYETRIRLW